MLFLDNNALILQNEAVDRSWQVPRRASKSEFALNIAPLRIDDITYLKPFHLKFDAYGAYLLDSGTDLERLGRMYL